MLSLCSLYDLSMLSLCSLSLSLSRRASGRFIAEGQYADVLIQKFLAGEPNRLMAKAPPTGASSDPLFSQFVGGLSIETTLKGVTTGLVTQGGFEKRCPVCSKSRSV